MLRRLLLIPTIGIAMLGATGVMAPEASAGYIISLSDDVSGGYLVQVFAPYSEVRVSYDAGTTTLTIQSDWNMSETSDQCATNGATTVTCTTGDPILEVVGSDGGSDYITAQGAAVDFIASGRGGDDVLIAGTIAATLNGGAGRDTLLGGEGGDALSGNSGNDYLSGGAGDDVIFAGSGVDRLFGDAGGDELYAKDQTKDSAIDCGAGKHNTELVRADAIDPAPVSC